MKVITVDGIVIKLGRNAKENTELVKSSSPKHFWVHLDSFPSGHVVIESELYNEDVIRRACMFCLENTKYRRLKNICFSVSRIENLVTTNLAGEVEFKS